MTEVLALLRVRAGISQSALASWVGLSRQTISMIENGKRPMSWQTYLSLLLFFDYNQATHQMLRDMSIFPEKLVAHFSGNQTVAQTDASSYLEALSTALSAFMRVCPDLIYIKDRDARYVCCSRAFAAFAGLADEEAVRGRSDYDLVEKSCADQYRAVDERVLRTGKPCLDYDEKLPEGVARYAKTSKYPLMDGDGNVIGVYGVTRDVTEYRVAFERLKLLTDNIPGEIATYACTPDSLDLQYFNDGFCKLFGVTRAEYEKRSAVDPVSAVFQEDMPAVMAQIERIIRDGTPMDCLYRAHVEGGGYKWIRHKAVIAQRHGNAVIVNAMLIDVTEQQEATERLRVSEEEHRLAMIHSGNIICRYSIADGSISMSPEAAATFKIPQRLTDMPEEAIRLGMVAAESVDAYTAFFAALQRGSRDATVVFQLSTAAGWRWMEASASVIFSADDKPVSAVISFSDVTEQLEKEAVYKNWQQSLREKAPESYTMFRSNLSKDVSFDTAEGSLLSVKFSKKAATFSARTAEYMRQFVFEEDRERYAAALNPDTLLANYYRGKPTQTLEYREKLPEGGVRWLCLSIELLEYPGSTDVEAYLLYEDIDETKKAALREQARAQNDPLTGVFNRHTFIEKMDVFLAESAPETLHALLMLDLDGFKLINDSFGHETGDRTLIDAAQTLRSMIRHGDLVGRLGGDEFIVFLNDIQSRADAARKAKQVCNALRRAFSVEAQLSASVGVAVFPDDGEDFASLYHKADVALYHVKATGKDNYIFYDARMDGEKPQTTGAAETADTLDTLTSALARPKHRMLIVEDNRANSEMLSNLFKDEFIIDTVEDGNAALLRLRRYGTGISVVLLDLILPGMDGFAVLREMRAHAEMQTIPVIVVSGMDERETSLRTIKYGASDFVTKPIDVDILRLRVQSALSRAENERLRAQNNGLALQANEIARCRAVLESEGTVIVEYDMPNELFTYDPSISQRLAGVFDSRPLWQILLADRVADAETVMRLQELTHSVLTNEGKSSGRLSVLLKTPAGARRRFIFRVIKRTDADHLGDKALLTFTDTVQAE